MAGFINDLVSCFTGKEADITSENADFVSGTILCDSSKAIADLGYVPRTLDEMVADSVAWLRSEGKLRG